MSSRLASSTARPETDWTCAANTETVAGSMAAWGFVPDEKGKMARGDERRLKQLNRYCSLWVVRRGRTLMLKAAIRATGSIESECETSRPAGTACRTKAVT